jgi:hypothetical protein
MHISSLKSQVSSLKSQVENRKSKIENLDRYDLSVSNLDS